MSLSPAFSCPCTISGEFCYFRANSGLLLLLLEYFCFCKPWKISHRLGPEV